jgi:hypothetical protein
MKDLGGLEEDPTRSDDPLREHQPGVGAGSDHHLQPLPARPQGLGKKRLEPIAKQVEDHVGGRDLTVQTVRWTGRRASGVAAVYPSLLTERMKKEMEMAATPSPEEGPPNPPDPGNPPA